MLKTSYWAWFEEHFEIKKMTMELWQKGMDYQWAILWLCNTAIGLPDYKVEAFPSKKNLYADGVSLI